MSRPRPGRRGGAGGDAEDRGTRLAELRAALDARPTQGPEAPPAVVAGRRRPRVVHLTTTDMSLDWLLRPQLEAFVAAGYEVVGVAGPSGHADALAEAGIPLVPLRHATRAMDPRRDAAALGELARLLRRLRPDVVHTHNPKPGVYGRLAARAVGVPVVVNTQHGLYALPEDPPVRRALVYGLERLAAAAADAELVQGPEDVLTLAGLGVPEDRLTLLGNGIDLDRFDPGALAPGTRARVRAELGVADDEVLVGAVGRLVWEKGLREVFEAARRLRADAPRVRVVAVGPADDDKADAIGPEDRARVTDEAGVVFAGRRDDMPEVYAALDVYVLASHREGFPRSAMEAAAMGLPVVTTDVRGCREVVEPGATGLLAPVGDAAALAAAVARLAEDEALRRAMGTAGRALARRRFDQRQVIATTLVAYDRLLRSLAAIERADAGATRPP